ncbi:hypothetical protein F0562_007623 [Nyssa sinensis]|uniref:AP180 N-terminal homology (ANTH) domain-containing protein n=1 Tax=Nyssa sinensis TaxID=561372 RepID=A0A5J5A6X3_9ASTE|nr:hypothetical protein F0562_007623 [Nyssa sinensis]
MSEFRDKPSYGMNRRSKSYRDFGESVKQEEIKEAIPVREMKLERVLETLNQLLRLLDGFLAYRFLEMEYVDCAKAFDAYVGTTKRIDGLVGFDGWCKDIGVARSFEYPEVQSFACDF